MNSKATFVVESQTLRALLTVKKINKREVLVEAMGRTYAMGEGDTLSLRWDEPVEEELNAAQ